MRGDAPIYADLHVDFQGIFLMLLGRLLRGDEILLHQVQAVQFFDGKQVVEVLNGGGMYIIEFLLAFENGLLGLVSRAEEFPAWEFGENDVQFEFGDKFFEFLVDALELAVSQFGDFGPSALLVGDLQHVGDLAVEFRLVVDDLGLQVHHQLLTNQNYIYKLSYVSGSETALVFVESQGKVWR